MAKITLNMTVKEMLLAMSDCNPGALNCMIEMLQSYPTSQEAIRDILYFDSIGIYGSKIYMLWNDCCKRDIKKLRETLHRFRDGVISKEAIYENLNRIRAVPFF